jgi:hypothetical protein
VLYLPTPCPECHELTMEVIDVGPDDGYEAKCTVCGCQSVGLIQRTSLKITKFTHLWEIRDV